MILNWKKYDIDVPDGGRGNRKVFCPRCHERRKNKNDRSLSVNTTTGMFYCHYCGWSGCAAEQETWERESYRRIEPTRRYRRPQPQEEQHHRLGERALAWFRSRGISEATLTAMQVTEGLEPMPQKDGKRVNTIQFNYFVGGELRNVKYRTGDKLFKMCTGAELVLYGLDNILGRKECVITEGEIDALSFYEVGRTDVVSVPNGANSNLSYLDDYLEKYFDDKETIFIAADTDTKGVVLRDELVRRFGAERCRIVTYGEGCKDANEELMKHGREALIGCLAAAEWVKVEGVFTLTDFEPQLDALFEHGMQRGATIGHECFDRLCSFESKRLCIVTGIPSSGKSEFIDEITERLNIRYGWRTAYFSPENAPLEYHASKLIEKFTGKKFSRDTLPTGEYRQVKRHIEENFSFIAPKSDFRLETILGLGQFLVRRRGIKVLVIDPYNRLENDTQQGQNETQHISRQLDMLTNFAQRNDLLVILMAHPTKLPKNKDGVIEAPTLYDISGSAHFYNKADFGIVVHRNRAENTVEVTVQKVKFRHLGECGTAVFRYNTANGRYAEYTAGREPDWDMSNHLAEETHGCETEERRTFDWSNIEPRPITEVPF